MHPTPLYSITSIHQFSSRLWQHSPKNDMGKSILHYFRNRWHSIHWCCAWKDGPRPNQFDKNRWRIYREPHQAMFPQSISKRQHKKSRAFHSTWFCRHHVCFDISTRPCWHNDKNRKPVEVFWRLLLLLCQSKYHRTWWFDAGGLREWHRIHSTISMEDCRNQFAPGKHFICRFLSCVAETLAQP